MALTTASHARAADMTAEEKVAAYLKSINAADRARITPVKDESVAKAFPKFSFVGVLFPQFPVGREVPAPLKEANVFAVPAGEGKPVGLTDVKQLEKFFGENVAREGKGIEDEVTKAWLRLSADLAQDGFYKFKAPVVTMGKGATDGKTIISAEVTGEIAVEPTGGNKGSIKATLSFKNGKLEKVDHKVNLMPGPRPICQATKLLDPDPIVRRMAEDSLRVMGSSAKYYLDEQRAKASPALQRAIDRMWQRIVDEGR
jgi:hypothetical protein